LLASLGSGQAELFFEKKIEANIRKIENSNYTLRLKQLRINFFNVLFPETQLLKTNSIASETLSKEGKYRL